MYHAGEDALRLPDVIARLRADLVRRGALKEAGGVSSLDLSKLLIETYLLEGQFPTRAAVLSPPLWVTCVTLQLQCGYMSCSMQVF